MLSSASQVPKVKALWIKYPERKIIVYKIVYLVILEDF